MAVTAPEPEGPATLPTASLSIRRSRKHLNTCLKTTSSQVVVLASNCKYDLVRVCAQDCGFAIVEGGQEDEERRVKWDLCWMDTGVCVERVLGMYVHTRSKSQI